MIGVFGLFHAAWFTVVCVIIDGGGVFALFYCTNERRRLVNLARSIGQGRFWGGGVGCWAGDLGGGRGVSDVCRRTCFHSVRFAVDCWS
jgi:hypothetical protein